MTKNTTFPSCTSLCLYANFRRRTLQHGPSYNAIESNALNRVQSVHHYNLLLFCLSRIDRQMTLKQNHWLRRKKEEEDQSQLVSALLFLHVCQWGQLACHACLPAIQLAWVSMRAGTRPLSPCDRLQFGHVTDKEAKRRGAQSIIRVMQSTDSFALLIADATAFQNLFFAQGARNACNSRS
jgi:hypothetical protein